jgi:hypothetical protein
MKDRKAKTVHLRLTAVGEWRIRKGWRRVNMVGTLCAHVCKRKNETC